MSNQSRDQTSFDWKDNRIKWKDIIKKEARGYEKGDDLGEVQEIGQEFVVTERGRLKKNKFYLPKALVAGYDGETLWFNITENEAEDNFKKDNPPQMGEYSRYKSASVTQQPDVQSQEKTDSLGDLQEYLPLIEKRQIDKVGTDASYTKTTAGIEDWDTILKKGVRTLDEISIGVVTAVNDDGVIVTSEGAKDEFNFPKDEIQSYNGQEVMLNVDGSRLEQFKVKVPR
jgi:Zn/Cd-binding protein ZinT